ncbi:hypothetical protein PsorP6_007193 [Peronosclerospora sorghi]|uniref:Uncharacterized protein n=1 Tax=Peronosclerospora sorghi TaxID=230839 RepID=A0ACC0WEA3_9STRA|nr:hypothetical protein PsorP6_007193 [Peronosclerospora sorghi]
MNRTITERAKGMLFHMNVDKRWWAEAMNTVVFITNRLSCADYPTKTPFELLFGQKPDISCNWTQSNSAIAKAKSCVDLILEEAYRERNSHRNTNKKRDTGRTAQLGNIEAAKAVSDIVRTTLGPRSMLKMLLDPMGGIVMTNDENSILRGVDVAHPAAKSMVELSRAQDEEVGDGTTFVIISAGELLVVAEPFLSNQVHPTVIIRGFKRALLRST